ncbi:DUF4129 domain-containing protein [Actinokineospora guangxiensis]|uniref:DUF4129 domain-containing protein n=1 Tax=Actinokineospora guangxiensis TaxID=1490288 RepID=A0ABW0EIF3_9PSEU
MWPPRIPPRRRVVLVVAALIAVAAVAAAGGSAIPSDPGGGWRFDQTEPVERRETESIADTDSVIDMIGGIGTGLLLAVVGVLVLLGALGVLVSFGLGGRRRRARPSIPVRDREADPPADDAAITATALRAAVRGGAQAVREGGPPGDAVISAWLVLEAAAASCGTRRSAAETASEFTARVLAGHAVDPDALADLRARYHRARFARVATAADAAAARAALARIEETIAAVPR